MANALSAFRLLLALPFAWSLTTPETAPLAALLLAVAILTDLIDGPIARRRGTTSDAGRALDHGADFLFVTSGLAAAASGGALPWVLPALIVLAFAQYVVDSVVLRRERALRMSELGRVNGILYFFPLGGVILTRLGLGFLEDPTRWVAWALVFTTSGSILDRLRSARRRAPDSPDAGRPDRSPH